MFSLSSKQSFKQKNVILEFGTVKFLFYENILRIVEGLLVIYMSLISELESGS